MDLLEKSILETITYFDIFDYPLQVNEIWRWLWKSKADLRDIISTLENSDFLKEKLSSKDGFFCLVTPSRGVERLIEKRLRRYRIAEAKYKKAKKIIRFLSKCPFVRGIAVCNNLGYSNSPQEGDIDLFVIAAKNRTWFVRMKIVGFLKFFRLRPGERKKDALCPSFFVDEAHLNLRELTAIMPPENDIHFIYWLNQMTPIFGINNIWQRFYEANQWTESALPNNYLFITNSVRKVKPSIFQKIFEIFLSGFVGDLVEKFCKYIQLKFLPLRIKSMMNKDNNVVIKDGVLKLHLNDRRKFYFEEFQNKISNFQYPLFNSQ